MGERPPGINVAIGLYLFATIAFILFWLAWFLAPEAIRLSNEECYIRFEETFPPADAWCALASFVAALGLWRRRPWGLLFGLMAAGAAIFLGLMDFWWDVRHGVYLSGTAEAYMELAIVLLLLGLGPVVAWLVWKERGWLLIDDRR